MLANGGGAIVNVASIYGLKPSDIGTAPYAASKFGVVGRHEMQTSRHSGMKRLGNAQETANVIVWLCSPDASYVNGAVLAVDGGGATRLY